MTISTTIPVKVRSIFTVLPDSPAYTSIQITAFDISGVKIAALSSTSTTITGNFHLYSKVAYKVASVVLSMTASTSTALCTPEILVSDAHVLYDSTNTDHSL